MSPDKRQTRTVFFRIGLRWHWKILSWWDSSVRTQGTARSRREAFNQSRDARKQLEQ